MPNFWSQRSPAHPCPPRLEEPEEELGQARLSVKALCVVKLLDEQSPSCLRKRKAIPMTLQETPEILWGAREEGPDSSRVGWWKTPQLSGQLVSAGWWVKSPPRGIWPWPERLLQKSPAEYPPAEFLALNLPTSNQGSKSVGATRSTTQEKHKHQEARTRMSTEARLTAVKLGDTLRCLLVGEKGTPHRIQTEWSSLSFPGKREPGNQVYPMTWNQQHTAPPPPSTTTKAAKYTKATVSNTLQIKQWRTVISKTITKWDEPQITCSWLT